ncbi:MAG: exopolyphosphatase [Flavobacteriaceae bacterium]|nr:exopolyphosphatase [Flavobacteriaceae bacterium]
MLKIRKFAAIDIGSNAVRLLVANILEQEDEPTLFRKNSLVRVPIRLGADVFQNNCVSVHNINRLKDAMTAFKLLMRTHGVEIYKACATSAMREADNKLDIRKEIMQESGIFIDIIDGDEEATIIAATDLSDFIDNTKTYLYVDVGGGSTEFSIIHNGRKQLSRSFKIGTVRLLNEQVSDQHWNDVRSWINEVSSDYDRISVIGTGGNINKIFKLSGKQMGNPLTYFYLSSFYEDLQRYSLDERIIELNLNTDRADVIIHAARIYLFAMKHSRAKHIYVPKIGLSDGIIKSLYYGNVQGHTVD